MASSSGTAGPPPSTVRNPPTPPSNQPQTLDPNLVKAAMEGNMRDFEMLISDPVISKSAQNQNTLLHIATEFGRPCVATYILGKDSSLLLKQNSAGDTPLHIAAREGRVDFVKLFLTVKEYDVEITNGGTSCREKLLRMENSDGDTALHCAARLGNLEPVKMLVKLDPKLCSMLNKSGESPLYLAVASGFLDDSQVTIIDRALSWASYQGPNGLTALHPAIFFPYYDIDRIKSLVGWKKEMIKIQDDLGSTPLHYASLYGRTEAINLFLENERSAIYILDNNGESALHIAAFQGHVGAVEEILKSCPDCCYLVDEKGRTALHAAVLGDQKEVVKFILKMSKEGCPMNKPDKDGNMPLHLAALFKLYGVIEILVKHNNHVNLNIKNKEFLTALDIYNKHDQEGFNPAVTRYLLENSTGAMTMQQLAKKEIKKMNPEITIIEIPPSDGSETKIDEKVKKLESSNTSEKQKALKVNLLVATLVATMAFSAGGFKLPEEKWEEEINEKEKAILSTEVAFHLFEIFNTLAFCSSVFSVLLQFYAAQKQRLRYMGIATFFTTIAFGALFIAFAIDIRLMTRSPKYFSKAPYIICAFFVLLFIALPFCDTGVEGFSSLQKPQKFVRDKIVELWTEVRKE